MIVRSFLFAVALSACAYLCLKINFSAARTADTGMVAPPAHAEIIEQCGRILTYVVRPGDTFQGIMSSYGVTCTEALSFYRSLASVGLSAIFPGDSLVLGMDRDERLRTFSLLSQLTCWYHMHRDAMALTVEKQPLRTASYRCIVKGTLNSSLSQDMFELGVGDALVAKLADIFAWDINFFIDPRKGDRFEVVFEKLYREGRFVAYGDILAAKYENRGTAKWAIAFDGGEGNRCYYGLDGTSVQKQFLKAPLRYRRVSSGYSLHRRHPILGIIRPHLGIDYAAPQGTPVYAAADGKVTFVGREGGFGNLVRIAHGGAYETSYGHLNNFAKGLHRNSRVAQGELVGTVGATGLATGPHLDYRMKRNGAFIDPQAVKLPAKKGVEPRDMGRFEAVKQTYMTLLERRFPKDGYFVLDIETVPSKDTAMTHISITAQKSDGTAEGS